MTALFLVIVGLLGYLAAHRRIEKLTKQRDDAVILQARAEANADDALADLAAETKAHAVTTQRAVKAERDAADNLTSLRVVLAAHAQDVILDPLGSDLIADEPSVTLVKGGRHG